MTTRQSDIQRRIRAALIARAVEATPLNDDLDDGPPDAETLAILVVLAEFEQYLNGARAAFNEAAHPRNPKGSPGGGKFKSLTERLTGALKDWHAGGGKGDPFEGFDREQLRRVAKARGIELKRGEDRDSISRKVLNSLVHHEMSQKADDLNAKHPESKTNPAKPKAAQAAQPRVTAAEYKKVFDEYRAKGHSPDEAQQLTNDEFLKKLRQKDQAGQIIAIGKLVAAGHNPEDVDKGYEAAYQKAIGEGQSPAGALVAAGAYLHSHGSHTGHPKSNTGRHNELDAIAHQLAKAESRDEGYALINQLKAAELRDLAKHLGMSGSMVSKSSKPQLADFIVQLTVGGRLSYQAQREVRPSANASKQMAAGHKASGHSP